MSDQWLIWSFEHRGWWRQFRVGYTQDLALAGRYNYDEAIEIVSQANRFLAPGDPPEEAMVPDIEPGKLV